ncbi:MAG: ShlB/FhaC/HecB family hemolysin secretion/activation protein [Methylococcales bacterium]
MLPLRLGQWTATTLLLLNTPGWAQPVGSSAGIAQLPALPEPAPETQPLSRQLRVFCREIKLHGNTVIPSTELHRLTAPYHNRYLTSQDLQQLRHDLTRYYVDRGFINSGAVIPDQGIAKGIIEIRIIEGRLQRLDIEGIEHFRESYLQDRIERDAANPLQIDKLQENLQLLLENPLIERINADLKPGSEPGLAILKTVLKERSPYQLGAVFDNQIAPSIGGYQGTVYAAHRNLTGNGDAFSAQGRFAEGLTGYGLDYWLPVNRYDTSVHAWYAHYDSTIVEQPFNQIDVTSNSESYGISLMQPLYRKPGRSFSGTVTLERRRSQTFLLDLPFSFSPGVQNGESSVTVLRVGQEWISRGSEQVIAARSTFNIGLDALDATINQNAPDGRFFSWLGQLQWARRLGPAQIIWRADVQLTNDPLLPLEKFQIGGANSVRGYRENQIVRDWGFSSSLEYRHPVLSERLGGDKLFIAPFADVGGAWNIESDTPGGNDLLTSVGLGLIFEPERRFHCHVYWGKALINVNNPDTDPQDYGFHFKVSGQIF